MAAASGAKSPARLVYSSRTWSDIIFREELQELAGGLHGASRFSIRSRESNRMVGKGYARRVGGRMFAETAWPSTSLPVRYVCGPSSFVEVAARADSSRSARAGGA